MGKLVSLGNFPTSVSANYAKARLAESGIESRVDGESFGTAMGLGSALGSIRLLVDSDFLERAKGLLEFDKLAGQAWFCAACQQPVDAGFEVCWSCGAERSEAEGKPNPVEKIDEADKPAPAPISNNPYEPLPEAKADPEDVYDLGRTETQTEAANLVRRARNATFLGVAFVPLIPYGTWLLIQAAGLTHELSEKDRIRFQRACLFNAFVIVMYALMVLTFVL